MIDTGIKNWLVENGALEQCDAAIILGSGLGGFEERLENTFSRAYEEIPGMPQTSVVGHSGSLHIGELKGKRLLVFSGRFHFYEGHSFDKTVIPVQLAHQFSCKHLLVSNAAGSINTRFKVGDLMMIDSLLYPNVSLSPANKRFFNRYNPENMMQLAKEVALSQGEHLQQGTYLYVTGPSYETKAEIRAFRKMGGDTVGMSTAAELTEASRLGIDSLGISLVTNMASGVSKAKLDHSEVKDVAGKRTVVFQNLVEGMIERL